MRRFHLVCYDIRDDKRLAQVREAVMDYGWRLQLSVYACEMTDTDAATLTERLRDIIHHHEDHVMIIDLGPALSPGKLPRQISHMGQEPNVPNIRHLIF